MEGQPSYTPDEIRALREDALQYIIPHFAQNEELAKGPKVFVRGEGCYLWDIEGKRYLDTFASLLTTICGHHQPDVDRAIREQLDRLEFFPNYVDAFTVPLIELARKLAEIMPGDLGVSFFVNSGSEANETALKMARQYHRECGEPGRWKVVARRNSYHATTLGAAAVTGLKWFREYFEPLTPGAVMAPPAACCACELQARPETCGLGCLRALQALVEWEGPETISAMIMDPIPGSNTGYPLPPPGYLEGVRELCDRHGILLIFDEVQTGFGKTGRWFGCEHWGVTPDIMTIGKGFTGGYIPLAAAVTTPRVADAFRRGPGTEFRSGGTYGGHTIACAATLANLRVIERDGLVERAAVFGARLAAGLEDLMRHRIVGEVRGIGMLRAVELMADRATRTPLDPKLKVGSFIREYCWERGMILRNNGDILVVAPALMMPAEALTEMLETMDNAIDAAIQRFGL